jgi:hypothetical protein
MQCHQIQLLDFVLTYAAQRTEIKDNQRFLVKIATQK